MVKINVLEVVLSNVNGVYFSGQVLQGHVNLELGKTLKLKGKSFKDYILA